MAIKELRFPTITTSATPSPPQQVDVGDRGASGRILGFRARLTGTDTAVTIPARGSRV